MKTKIIFCHIPKTGGYSLLNWFKKDLKLYEFNDSARSKPLDQQIQKYHESTIIEIHGGSPQSIDHLRNSVPKAHELFISIIRNPVEQFESLCRDAYVHQAFLDLPLVSRGFISNDLESIYRQEYDNFNFNIHDLFQLYREYWFSIKSKSSLIDDQEFLQWVYTHVGKGLILPLNPDYLFRRNSQSTYLMQTFGRPFIQQIFAQNPNCYLLTTEQLEKQFIWLLLNNSLLKELSIFGDYAGVYKITDIEKRLKETRKNITPQITNKKHLKLNAYESYLFAILNQVDYNIWNAITCQWNNKFSFKG